VGSGDGRNQRYGYIDKTGNYVIEPLFNDARNFFQLLQDGNALRLDNFPPLARVEIDGKVSYINTKGNIINPDDTQSSDKRK
ncbi:MAG: WG repeat-containing protein, partial [Candidatus Poribacteria bacterium]|nr:WG repeat-containing protein [Candidatus Poribacteria bacterium]